MDLYPKIVLSWRTGRPRRSGGAFRFKFFVDRVHESVLNNRIDMFPGRSQDAQQQIDLFGGFYLNRINDAAILMTGTHAST